MSQKEKVVFGIVGSGWRAECFMQVARLLPEIFTVCGIVTRSKTRKTELEEKWGGAFQVFTSAAEMLKKTTPDFLVTAVAKEAAASVILELAAMGAPVLAETPPAFNLQEMITLYRSLKPDTKLQIAEQYYLQPIHQARIAFLQTGRLGAVNYSHISISHSYHGISLIRKTLGIGFENAVINGFSFELPSVEGPGRNGLPDRERIVQNAHTLAVINFGTKIGFFDFENNQHRSWARSQRVLIRGVRGEISNNSVKFLQDYRTPVAFDLIRQNAGEYENLEGYYLKGILGGTEWLYRNPFVPARLSDDEIAIATCLVKMKEYLTNGTEFYSLAEALQDQYLALMVSESQNKTIPIVTTKQIWSD